MKHSLRMWAGAFVVTATAGCVSPPSGIRVDDLSSTGTSVGVGPIRFELPPTWAAKTEDSKFKATSDRNETLYMSINTPPKRITDRNLSATELLGEFMDMQLTGQYQEADMKVALPLTPIRMVCKEPAAKAAYTYAGKDYLVTYAIAEADAVYLFDFHGTGNWIEAMRRFDSIVMSARLMARGPSAISGDIFIQKLHLLEVEYSGNARSSCL